MVVLDKALVLGPDQAGSGTAKDGPAANTSAWRQEG
jgi:hypothetical protein